MCCRIPITFMERNFVIGIRLAPTAPRKQLAASYQGDCPQDCKSGYQGVFCKQVFLLTSDNSGKDSSSVGLVAGAISAVLVAVLLVFLGFFCDLFMTYRQRQAPCQQPTATGFSQLLQTISNPDPPAGSSVPEPAEFDCHCTCIIFVFLKRLLLQHCIQLKPVSNVSLKKYVN